MARSQSIEFAQIPVNSLYRKGTTVYKKTSEDTFACMKADGTTHWEQTYRHDCMYPETFILVTDEWMQARAKQKRNQALSRKEKDDCMRSLGLKKVRGSLGGTYWE